MVIAAEAPTPAPTYSWHVTIDGADAAVRLRDYFLRLGVAAEVRAPTVVGITVTDAEDHDLEGYVSSWHEVNRIGLHLAPANAPRPPVELARRFVTSRAETPPLLSTPETVGQAVSPLQARLPKLGELLIEKGLISGADLAWALGEARATSRLLGLVLLQEKLIYEDELARTLSEQLSIPYVSIMRNGVDFSVVGLLPPAVGAAAAAIPIRRKGGSVQIGFADPTDPEALAAVVEHVPDISVAVSELSDIKLAWVEFNQRFRHGNA
jgi:hypothetical protein